MDLDCCCPGSFSPIILLFILYEISPWRRQQLFDYENAIITVLARKDETRGRDLRISANAEVGRNFTVGTFYCLMARLEEQDIVTARNEEELLECKGATDQVTRYKLTGGGRRLRTSRLTMKESIQALPGWLAPVPG